MKINAKGNVLFLILIAVALFAALTYAITQSGRAGGDGLSREQAKLKATELLQYATLIQQTMIRLTYSNGCNYRAIDSADAFGDPDDDSGPCNVFDPVEGGGVDYKRYPNTTSDIYNKSFTSPPYPYKRSLFINVHTVEGLGTSLGRESILYYFYIDPNLCQAINDIADIGPQPEDEENVCHGCSWTNPINTSAFGGGYNGFALGNKATNLRGKSFGCYSADDNDNNHHFYYVLNEQ